MREAVRSEVATARQRGDDYGPLLAWQELKRDELHGFGFAEEFASRIELDLNRVVPREADSPKATLTRQQAGDRLFALMEEWKARCLVVVRTAVDIDRTKPLDDSISLLHAVGALGTRA